MPTYSRREQLSSLAAFGLAAAVAPASAYDIVPAAEIDRQLAALRAEADAASSGSPDGSYERPAADTPSAGKSSTGASSAACKSEEAGTPPALPQAAQLAVAGTVGIALLGSASLGFLAGSSKSADVSSRTLQSERLRFAEEPSRLRSSAMRRAAGWRRPQARWKTPSEQAPRLKPPQGFDALADERAHLEAGLSAAKDEILGLKAGERAPWRGAGGAGGGGGRRGGWQSLRTAEPPRRDAHVEGRSAGECAQGQRRLR